MQCEICSTRGNIKKRQFKPTPAYLCNECHGIAKRAFNSRRGRDRTRIVAVPTRQEWIAVLKKAVNKRRSCFECQLTHVALDIRDDKSPSYATLEHADPGSSSGGWLVVAAFVNDMKSDLDTLEFMKVLSLLPKCVRPSPSRKAIADLEQLVSSFKHWSR